MLASHRTDIDGLDSPHSAIIFELYAGEITQGICHRERVEALEFRTFEGLRLNDIFIQHTRRNFHLLYLEAAVQRVHICIALRKYRVSTECRTKYEKYLFCHCSSYSKRTYQSIQKGKRSDLCRSNHSSRSVRDLHPRSLILFACRVGC